MLVVFIVVKGSKMFFNYFFMDSAEGLKMDVQALTDALSLEFSEFLDLYPNETVDEDAIEPALQRYLNVD